MRFDLHDLLIIDGAYVCVSSRGVIDRPYHLFKESRQQGTTLMRVLNTIDPEVHGRESPVTTYCVDTTDGRERKVEE